MGKKKIALFIVLVLLLCACGRNEDEDTKKMRETPAEDFRYEMVDGEVIITGYTGAEREIHVPAEINDRPVTQIAEQAFYEYDMTSIVLPDSVMVIAPNAFASCMCLKNVTLPDSQLRIEGGAFYECDALENVILPNSLAYIGDSAFGYCDNLKELVLPGGFTGFEISYKMKYAVTDQNQVYIETEGSAIEDPVPGGYTMLIAEKGSETERMLKGMSWYDDIQFEVR